MNVTDRIIDHYKHPRCRGSLSQPTAVARDVNPFCGDEITVELEIVHGIITNAAFDGRGCSLSQAAASMLLEAVVGCSASDAATWGKAELLNLLQIEIGPVRLKCALLPLQVMHSCLAQAATDLQTIRTSEGSIDE